MLQIADYSKRLPARGGCAAGRSAVGDTQAGRGYPKDKQVWLKAGDHLVTSIERLGDLEFSLV